ncbi:MAG: (Fe-S)-binding protein, partial [Alphaproteobacteria bacterium]
DWKDWPGGLSGAAEMCNNNGACRKSNGGVMCPSFRVTGQEKDLTRGRANVLRLALTGQLGRDAFTSDEMADAMALCVGCKACQSECPMSVDMAKMKTEVQAARVKKKGLSLRDVIIATLPRMAPIAATIAPLANRAILMMLMCCYLPILLIVILTLKPCGQPNVSLREQAKPSAWFPRQALRSVVAGLIFQQAKLIKPSRR